MNELIKKITAYDLLSNLIPGVVTAFFYDRLLLDDALFAQNIVFVLVACYAFGVVGSRVGSLILEPAMKKLGFIRRGAYSRFVRAQRRDDKLDMLVTVSNMYRAFAGSALLSLLAFACSAVPREYRSVLVVTALALLFVLFIAAWRKQERYVAKRIDANEKSETESDDDVSD